MKNSIKKLTSLMFVIMLVLGCGGSPSDSGGDDGDTDPPQTDTTPPSAPGNAEGSSGDATVDLTWDANSESDLEGYNIYRSQSSFSSIAGMNPINSSAVTSNTYTDQNLQNGTTYFYRVSAIDADGNESSGSGEVEVTPFADPPDRPKK